MSLIKLTPEYWRFDATGEFHGARLAGDRLVGGRYEPIDIAELADGVLQGSSLVMNLDWRWDNGQLGCDDPATGVHITTFDDLQASLELERARADNAAARVRELEARVYNTDL